MEGACGVVYVAEQTQPVRRRVALKIIKLGMDTRSVIARFEAERQALVKARSFRPVRVSQTLTVASQLAEARRRPLGLKAKPQIWSVWPRRVKVSWPALLSTGVASQIFVVLSPLTEARRWPSELHAKPVTSWVCPRRVPHIAEGVIDSQSAALEVLHAAVTEMERRYKLFKDAGAGVADIHCFFDQPSNRLA